MQNIPSIIDEDVITALRVKLLSCIEQGFADTITLLKHTMHHSDISNANSDANTASSKHVYSTERKDISSTKQFDIPHHATYKEKVNKHTTSSYLEKHQQRSTSNGASGNGVGNGSGNSGNGGNSGANSDNTSTGTYGYRGTFGNDWGEIASTLVFDPQVTDTIVVAKGILVL